MTDPILHYVHDPLCGWCYAAAPMVGAVRDAGIPISLHGGGLWESPTTLAADKGAHIRESDARIASLTGQPFGQAYLSSLLSDPATTFWSKPLLAAINAAERLRPGAGLDMLHAIQAAHYVDGRRVVEDFVLRNLAAGIRLDTDAFEAAFDLREVDEHVARSRALMARSGLRGFPGFLVEAAGVFERIQHEQFYGHPASFVDAVSRNVRRRVA